MATWRASAQPGWNPPSRKKTTAGCQSPNPDYIREKLLLADWLTRDIATPDHLLGDLLSTTSRVLLVGPTGLGKTNLGLAIAYAIAAGDPFLHWRASEGPRRVLYIDGEMPERLMRNRLEDAGRRLGGSPETLFILSREDFTDMPPLNVEAGQQFINRIIEILCGVDLVIFDNIQSLLAGSLKEDAGWQEILPWIRELTRQKIGQIWVHHTGHDETHSYGDKSREWQLDTVILLEQIERPGADIGFRLKFTKCRQRTPDNRADFEPAIVTLANDKWASERGNVGGGKRPAKDRAPRSHQPTNASRPGHAALPKTYGAAAAKPAASPRAMRNRQPGCSGVPQRHCSTRGSSVNGSHGCGSSDDGHTGQADSGHPL